MRCAALVFLSFGVPCALAAGTQERFTSESKFTDALSVLSRMAANPSSLSIALDQAGSGASNVFASGKAAGVGGTESATVGSDAAADALTNSIGSLFGDDMPKAMGLKKTAAKATVPKAHTVPMANVPKAPLALKVEASKAPSAPKVNVPQPLAGPKTKSPQAQPASKVEAQPAPPVRKANVPQAPPAPKASVPKAPSAVPKAMDGTKRSVQATKHSGHSPHPKLAATSVHPSTAKTQSKSAVSKRSMISKSVHVVQPQVAKPKPTLSNKSGSATKHTSGIGQSQPKVPIKVEELEAEVSALKAKLVTVKPLKGTLPPPHQPAAPSTIVSVASVVAKQMIATPPPVAVNGPVVANRPPAVSSRVVAFSPVTRQGEFALGASARQAVPTEHATVKPALVAAVSPSKAPAPVQLPTSSVLSMTMVPIAAVAPASITAASGPQSTSFFAAVSHWFRTMFEGRPLPAPLLAQLSPPDPNAGRPPFSTQNIAQTARSTYEDGLADVAIEDEFVQREREDAALVETVKREDRSLRLDAETPRKPSMPAPANYQHSLGSPHVSSFWGTLAEEDADIEKAVSRDDYDLSDYERLTALQDDKVLTAETAINAHLGGRLGKTRQALRNIGASAA